MVRACKVRIFDVFAQLARSSARSVAFCSLRNRSSFVMPNCDFAWSGDTEAAAAIHTASIKAVCELGFGDPISIFNQTRSKSRLQDGMCNTWASGLTASIYRLSNASASILVGRGGGSISLLEDIDIEPPKSRLRDGDTDGMCSADNNADDCGALCPATDDVEGG